MIFSFEILQRALPEQLTSITQLHNSTINDSQREEKLVGSVELYALQEPVGRSIVNY
jgi:hypothetical protein